MDRRLPVAIGAKCNSTRWKNTTMSWPEITERLSNTTYTWETADEYTHLGKEDKAAVKDHGGFVGGELKDGKRKKANVLSRSIIALDADKADVSLFNRLDKEVWHLGFAYTTHSHRPEKPRMRLIFPLTRDVNTDEFVAISRYLADSLGMEQFDECSFRPQQLMYWPTTSKGAEFRCMEFGREWIDPDEFLSAHPNWTDFSVLPTSPREKPLIKSRRPVADPLEKRGLIGLFCRAYYPIQDAIDTFLSEVYTPSAIEGRYDYIPADSKAGVVIYDDKWAYSNHATDPASGQLLNAYDLVRIHLYGEEGDEDMKEFASSDARVKTQKMRELRESVDEEFDELDGEGELSEDVNKEAEGWEAELDFSKKGELLETANNFRLILEKDSSLASIRYNELTGSIDVKGETALPWTRSNTGWSDKDFDLLSLYIEKRYPRLYSPSKLKTALTGAATDRKFHPIKDFILSRKWDGVKRLDTLLIDYLGAEDSEYTRAVTRKTFTAAVARVFRPGIKFDQMLIINGPQGIGKSTILARLGGEWFCDTLTLQDMKDKTGSEKLIGYFILEVGELAGMKKAEVESIKSFISRTDDTYRAAYAVNVESHPRQCILIGTTNAEQGYLRDVTGNRRFWPVTVSGTSRLRAWDLDGETVMQIWAEAYTSFKDGEQLYLRNELRMEAEKQQRQAMESDDLEGLIEAFVNMRLPKGKWTGMTSFERYSYFNEYMAGKHSDMKEIDSVERLYVCNMEIWHECLGKSDKIDRAGQNQIAAIMQRIESWSHGSDSASWKGRRSMIVPPYGKQRVYCKNV